MARNGGSSSGGLANIAVRCLPTLLLPCLIGVMQPQSGLAGLPLILVAMAFGAVISAAVPHARLSLVAVVLLTGLLLCTAYVQELKAIEPAGTALPGRAEFKEVAHADGPARQAPDAARGRGERPRPVEQVAALRWRAQPVAKEASGNLETMSIVLPCAFEGVFAEKTVEAIWKHTTHSRLKEILVVDDGSVPPLRTIISERLLKGGPGVAPMRIIRHERTKGLIGAKKSGGDAAVGDIIVFLDCHISPRRGWEEAIIKQMKRAGDHRTVVVPTITSLDPDTWEEIQNGAMGKSCYVLWNSDFTWLSKPGRDAPLMSGGLLAMSRKWWQETEGYDEHMIAWGGENIDQSLRIWLCGGRIEVADDSYVAHMWRDPKNPKTTLRYPIPTMDVMRNKARASKAWFGEFVEKVFSFPEYEAFTKKGESLGDMSNFERVRKKLNCAPFTHYLSRFSYVYLDTGLIPLEVFQVREKKTGFCLERQQRDSQPHNVVLAPCGGGEGGGPPPELQLWHLGNRDRSRTGMPCCSGLMNWNFLQCMDAVSVGSKLRTFECEIQGSASNQFFALENDEGDGQLFWRPKKADHDGVGCLATVEAKVADAALAPGTECSAHVLAESKAVKLHLPGGEELPSHFRIRSKQPRFEEEVCGVAVGAEASDSASNFQLQFQKCDNEDPGQVFHAKKMLNGIQIRAGDTDNCLDTAGGSKLLVYPCYEESVQNMNQVWHIRNDKLVWLARDGHMSCVDARAIAPDAQEYRKPGTFKLETCTPKKGQRLQRHMSSDDGSFMLKDADGGGCLGYLGGSELALTPCDDKQRWRELIEKEQVQHVASKLCIDSGANEHPVLYPCHQPRVFQKQRFQIVDEPGWVQLKPSWGDNGRRRWFEKCLDHMPQVPVEVTIQRCPPTRKRGTRWERLHTHAPLERRLWEKAAKPPPGAPVLGGEAAPPT